MAYTFGDIENAPGQVYDFLKRKFVSLTKPDEEGDYSSRKGSISRQQKLAEALSQMGAQEQAVSTAGGITAPMSGMGALARGLTSFGGPTVEGGTFNLGGTSPQTPLAPQDRGNVQMRDVSQSLPDIMLGDVKSTAQGARPYEDQQRLLREYRRSSDPNVRQMATEERALIEAERERNKPTWRQPGDQLFTNEGVAVGTGVPMAPRTTYVGGDNPAEDYIIVATTDDQGRPVQRRILKSSIPIAGEPPNITEPTQAMNYPNNPTVMVNGQEFTNPYYKKGRE